MGKEDAVPVEREKHGAAFEERQDGDPVDLYVGQLREMRGYRKVRLFRKA